MTSKPWIGSAKTDWFAPDAWSSSGVPADGNAVVIASGGPTPSHEDEGNGPIGSHAVTLGSKDFPAPASITSYGYDFGNGFDISVGDAAPFATLNFRAEYAQNETLEADTTFDGGIDVSNGTLNLDVDVSNLSDPGQEGTAPVLLGSGTTTIEHGGMAVVTGAVAATQAVSFEDANGTLFLNGPADFDAHITGFWTGDRIRQDDLRRRHRQCHRGRRKQRGECLRWHRVDDGLGRRRWRNLLWRFRGEQRPGGQRWCRDERRRRGWWPMVQATRFWRPHRGTRR